MNERITSTYALELHEETQTLTLPKGSRILAAFMRQEHLYVTVEHCINQYASSTPKEEIEFAVFRAEREFCVDDYSFVGTVVAEFGTEVYQVFYKKL